MIDCLDGPLTENFKSADFICRCTIQIFVHSAVSHSGSYFTIMHHALIQKRLES